MSRVPRVEHTFNPKGASEMFVELRVERSLEEYAVGSRGLVAMDPAAMAEKGWRIGQLVKIATFGKSIVARLAPPLDTDRQLGLVRLDRLQRQALKARLLETVELSAVSEKTVNTVRIQPSIDLGAVSTHHLAEHLKEEMAENRAPVASGMLLFLHFHHSVAGTLFKVLQAEGGPGVVDVDSNVVLEPAPAEFGQELALDITFSDIGGLDGEIDQVRELVQFPLQFPQYYRQLGIRPVHGVIFHGPPGTGKSRLARAIANEVDAQFYYINGPDIIGTMYGESEGNLRRIYAEAIHHAPSVIFIDELDVLTPKRGETGSHSDTRLVTQLLSLMDGMTVVDGVVVIGTTNRIESIDLAFRRPGRFDRELYIGPPTESGRLQILAIHSREMPLSPEAGRFLPELAQRTNGFVGADLMELCREAGLGALRRAIGGWDGRNLARLDPASIRVEPQDFLQARSRVRPSAMRETLVIVPSAGFETVVGMDTVKADLLRAVKPLLGPVTQAQWERQRDGVLLEGPPGTGKTVLAKALAKETGANLIWVSGPELFTKWLGESEESVRHIFRLARQLMPSLVVFDQLDALAPIRGDQQGSWTTERMVSQLIAELDSLEATDAIAVVGITNRVDLIDSALLRAGRMGTRIATALPDETLRCAILAAFLDWPSLDSLQREALVRRTEGQSGAELRRLADRLRMEGSAAEGLSGIPRTGKP